MAVASAGLYASLHLDNHASTPPLSFLQAGCPSCRPTNSNKALKARKLETVSTLPPSCLRFKPSASTLLLNPVTFRRFVVHHTINAITSRLQSGIFHWFSAVWHWKSKLYLHVCGEICLMNFYPNTSWKAINNSRTILKMVFKLALPDLNKILQGGRYMWLNHLCIV